MYSTAKHDLHDVSNTGIADALSMFIEFTPPRGQIMVQEKIWEGGMATPAPLGYAPDRGVVFNS